MFPRVAPYSGAQVVTPPARYSSVLAVVALLAAGTAGAQSRATLAGQWVLAESEQASVASRGDGGFRTGDMGSGWGSPLTIVVEPTRLIATFNPYSAYDLQPTVSLTYPVDGSEARNQINLGFTTTVFTSRAAWQDGTLTATDWLPVPPEVAGPGVTALVRRTLTLRSTDTLMIETTRVGIADAPTVTSRSTYTRSR